MQVYACPMGMSLEDCNSVSSAEAAIAKGYKLLCRQDPVYGGSGNPHVTASRSYWGVVREMVVVVKDDGGGGEGWCVWCPLTLSLTP